MKSLPSQSSKAAVDVAVAAEAAAVVVVPKGRLVVPGLRAAVLASLQAARVDVVVAAAVESLPALEFSLS